MCHQPPGRKSHKQLNQLASFDDDISAHFNSCKGNVSFIGETYCNGMVSILSAKCCHCRLEIAFSTSTKIDGVSSGKRWECNVATVWGQMCNGGGHTRLQETTSILGVPTVTKKSLMATEKALGKCWSNSLEQTMKEAAEEERRIAIEKGSLHH